MRSLAGLFGILGLSILFISSSAAEDKKAPDKDEAKQADKNEQDKKDTDDKKKKELKKNEDKVVYGDKLKGKMIRIDANSAKEFTIQAPQVDPVKVNQLNFWKMTEVARIMSTPVRNPQQQVERNQRMINFQMQLARKQSNDIYTMKDKDLAAAENCKFRSMFPPAEFDDKGKQKVYTQKELKALRGQSKLPGYPAEFDRLAVNQVVTVYLAKQKTPAKGEKTDSGATKNKNPDDDNPVLPTRPEAVMIVIEQEAPMQR